MSSVKKCGVFVSTLRKFDPAKLTFPFLVEERNLTDKKGTFCGQHFVVTSASSKADVAIAFAKTLEIAHIPSFSVITFEEGTSISYYMTRYDATFPDEVEH